MIETEMAHIHNKPLCETNPITSVPALFGALAINTIPICRNDPIRRELAQNKSRQCMLALSQLASWPVRTWILKAFVNLIKRLTGLSSGAGGSIISVTSNVVNDGGNTAAWGDIGSDFPHTTGSQNPSQPMNEPQSLHLRSDQGPQPPFIHRSEFGNIHAGDLSQLSDQVMNDSFWAGYVDNMFDSDLLLHESTGPLFSLPPETIGRGEPNTSDM
ncbi:unnamed protein product [Penicillium salamii]|uniref:Uncharacterized protein n=1 Tax=Penicillium salamii TaxID=1612424 RepID=A0A9W4J986_9EURO|nr:unnamed protein product [Penicillium salamii]CAG8097667.1 unnamed protein product [Penicillium salamii]CAG8139315.1 unnamed protein product [Penicillium salamii]CAG8193312.1 unnamed protein product [Penicillium salamii]CAG8296803.1 unnamed protein product [Penicillium salamii]